MPKVSRAHLDSRRRQILEAAFRCFSRAGFRRTSMRDICREAGLSAGAVYTYFDGKEQIVEVLGGIGRENTRQALQSVPEGRDSLDSLARLLDFILDFMAAEKSRASNRLDVRLWGEALDNARVRRLFQQAFENTSDIAAVLVAKGQERGEITAGVTAQDTAQVLIGVYMGLCVLKAIDPTTDLSGCAAVLRSLLEGSFATKKRKTKQKRRKL